MGRSTVALAARLAVTAAGGALLAWAAVADPHWAERHVLGSYCATGPATAALARWAPFLGAALGVLALAAAGLVARRAGRLSLRFAPGRVLAVAAAVAAALGVTELYLRHLQDRLFAGGAPSPDRPGTMARPDGRLGWAYVPRRVTWSSVGGRAVAYAIDADGDRTHSPEELTDPARPTVLFAGESIAFGYGLAYEETYPFQVGQDLGVQAVNLAVVGYGSDQAYLRVVDALARFRRPLAVVTLFHPGQLRRNLERWRPHLALDPGGELVTVPAATGPRLARLLDELPWRGDEALRATAAVLRATAAAARARGAVPLFVVTNYGRPCLHDAGGEAWIVDELFVRQGLPFVRVDLGPDDRLPGIFEEHPGPGGARRIAAAVEAALAGQVRR
jgi:hypothetical protein